MSKASHPSFVTLPSHSNCRNVLEFLVKKFPHIPEQVWLDRIKTGKVFWRDGGVINVDEPYQPNSTLGYYREVPQEPTVPFEELIITQNDHFLIAHKPHFLPVMPGGQFVNECLQARLIEKTGIKELQAVHRLDRDTAGLVLFSTNPATRNKYHQLFAERRIAKTYQAVASINSSKPIIRKKWHVKNYLKRSQPKFLFENTTASDTGQYAESIIECIDQSQTKALVSLSPITGRTHQLRLHMQHIGFPILNDRFYPTLQPKQPDDFHTPLQLLAKSLSFVDPVTQREETFKSPTDLEI